MTLLRVAIVGCGIISPQHIDAFVHNRERARITAFCDTDPAKAEAARNAYLQKMGDDGEAYTTTDYASLLADERIDAVDLLLPHNIHAKMAVAAAQAGKHILCEKPLALTLKDCDRMVEAADQAGVILMHGENMRLAETAERGAALIREGRLGVLVGIQATYAHWQSAELNRDWRTQPDEAGGGHLIDGAIHWVDMMRHLCGEITEVQAMATRFRPELGAQSEDTGVLNFRYAGGHLGQLFATHASRGRGASPSVTVFGTEGCLTLDAFPGERALVLFPRDAAPEVIVARQSWQDTFRREAAHFIEVTLDGVPLCATPADGKANLQVVLAAYEAIRTGNRVVVAEIEAA